MDMQIDTTVDFTNDSPGYWDGFWEKEDGRGVGGSDPDSASDILRNFHKRLWSRPLPNGEVMDLQFGTDNDYLIWNGFRFGSDSILASFRYKGYRWMLGQLEESIPNYKAFVENYLRQFYTIGGMMIFPKRPGGINQARGTNPYIRDRWDLTMECIRLYYNKEDSPLDDVLSKDSKFFDLFVDFKGFVDFFFLQDCVSKDYSSVVFWEGDGEWRKQPFPQTVDDYWEWIDRELVFVRRRNKKIIDWQYRENNKARGKLDINTLKEPMADWSRAKGHICHPTTDEEKLILIEAKDFSELTPKLQKYVKESVDYYNETGAWFGQF